MLHDRVPPDRVRKITEKDYSVRGCTALPDAVANAICHIGNVRKYALEEARPKTILASTTDGMEDAGHPYSCGRVKQMAERQKEKYGREFLFPGAGIDGIETAGPFRDLRGPGCGSQQRP